MLSKKQFDEFFLPYLKQTVKRLNEFQGSTSIHICGNTRDRWKEVVDAGVVRFCIEQAGDNPCGYNLCPGCTTPVGTSKENMTAFMNAAAVYGKGARKGRMPRGMQEILEKR